ncbi:MAG: hypothetical protein HZA91_18230 [Verrucomicrobia bacterium]|nr:hypothetical protein [Verrucomicrobiota bacterium]
MKTHLTRRSFIHTAAAGSAALTWPRHKSEIRNSKPETNPKCESEKPKRREPRVNGPAPKTTLSRPSGTLRLRIWNFEFVSDFGFRTSDFRSRGGHKRLWSADRLKAYREKLQDLKGNARVCAPTVGLSQTLLLADRSAMDHILEAIRKIKAYSAELAKKA